MVNTIPPESVRNNAQRGLSLRKEWGRGGTEVGVRRANQIKLGKSLSRDTIAAMSSFARFLPDYNPSDKEDDGGPTANTIAVLLWGGVTGINWAQKKLDEIDSEKGASMPLPTPEDFEGQEGFMERYMSEENILQDFNAGEQRAAVCNSQWKESGKLDSNGIQHKYVDGSFEVKQDGDNFTIEGYASTFGNIDNGNDIVEKGAFKKSLRNRKPKMLLQHKTDQLVGVWDSYKEDDRGLYIKGRLADTQAGREARELAKMGALDGLSIGFAVKQAGYDDKKGLRYLKELELFEVSLVTFPMNESATITSVKSIETTRDFETFLRDAGFSRKRAKEIASCGFGNANDQRDVDLEGLNIKLDELLKKIKG